MPDDRDIDPLLLHDVRDADRRTHELLAQVLAEMAHIRKRLDARERIRPVLSRLHHATLSPLLAEINAAVGATFWTGRALVEHAAAKDSRLLRAIRTACGGVRDDGMVRRLGKLLAQGEGEVIGGYLVTRSESGREGCEWQVMRV